MIEISNNLNDTYACAQKFIATIKPHTDRASVIGLSGDLGSGKTTFTQALAKILGVQETVTSPTFVIEKIYKLDPKKNLFTHLIHIDAYRLESGKELESLGWKDITNDPTNLILLEWPEKVADVLPQDIRMLHFIFKDETTREISWE